MNTQSLLCIWDQKEASVPLNIHQMVPLIKVIFRGITVVMAVGFLSKYFWKLALILRQQNWKYKRDNKSHGHSKSMLEQKKTPNMNPNRKKCYTCYIVYCIKLDHLRTIWALYFRQCGLIQCNMMGHTHLITPLNCVMVNTALEIRWLYCKYFTASYLIKDLLRKWLVMQSNSKYPADNKVSEGLKVNTAPFAVN